MLMLNEQTFYLFGQIQTSLNERYAIRWKVYFVIGKFGRLKTEII